MTDEPKTRGEQLVALRPEITDADIYEASAALRAVRSWNALPVPNERGFMQALVIKTALGNGTVETVIVDRLAADALRLLLNELERVNWQVVQLGPPPEKQN